MADGANSGTRKGSPAPAPRSAQPSVVVEELRVSDLVPIDEAPAVISDSMDDSRDPPNVKADRTRADFVHLPHGTLVGEYEIEKQIGEGGMGAVYSAVHPVLGKRVAIKVISQDISRDTNAIARFRREARAVAQLNSEHIVDVFGFGELADGRAYFVMEYLVGESLRERIARGRVPLDEALELLEQLVRGLEVAHEAGVVHRDLKPENVFIERRRNAPIVVKLLDFGIVKLANQEDDVSKTQAGVLIGTPVYVAPEQIKAATSVDHRADIYALGGVAFEMIVGRVPFVRSTVVELVAAHLEVPPPHARTLWADVPSVLDAMLFAMLSKDPAKRPTLGYIQETIEKLRRSAFTTPAANTALVTAAAPAQPASEARTRVPPTPLPQVAPPRRPRKPVQRWIALAGVIALSAVTLVVATSHSTDDERVPVKLHESPVVIPILPPTSTPAPNSVVAAPSPPAPVPPAIPVTPRAHAPQTGATSPTIQPPDAASASKPAPSPATVELAVSSKPPCTVLIDDQATGRHTPIAGLMLDPGMHTVTFLNDAFGINETVTAQFLVGKPVRINKDFMPRVNTIDPNGTIDPFKRGSGPR